MNTCADEACAELGRIASREAAAELDTEKLEDVD